MKPLFLIVVAINLVLVIHALPENIEDVKELPQNREPVLEAEETEPQARRERCTTCSGTLKLNVKSPKEVLAALTALPGAEVHTQQSFEGCSSDKGCAGIKVKDGQVLERFGNLDAFRAAAAQDTGNEFSFHAAGSFDNGVFEGGVPNGGPFWWMNQDSPFKNAGGSSGSFEKFSKSSSSSFTSNGGGGSGAFGANVDLGANPFLNGDFSKLAGGFASTGSASTGSGSSVQEANRPSTFQQSSFESSSFNSVNKGEVDLSKNPFLSGGLANANFGFGSTGSSGFNNKFGSNGYTGSTPGPFTASTAGSNVNLIQNTQKASEFDFEQNQQTQNIDEAFQNTGNVHAHEHSGGDLQQTCAGQGYVCVHKAQCNNGVVNSNGGNLLQARTQKQYCNTKTEICCRIEISGAGSQSNQGTLGVGSATFTGSGQGNLFQGTQASNSASFGQGNSFNSAESFNRGQSSQGTTGFGSNTGFSSSFGANTGSINRGVSTPTRFNSGANEVFKSTSQSNFIETDSFSAGSENTGIFRPGASGSGLKPGIPYLPPVDNTNSGSNVVSSTAFPTTFVTSPRPFSTPRPFTTAKPVYLPPVTSTAAPGYLPPVGESSNNRETRLPPNPTYNEGGLILDETRQPNFRPSVTPAPVPSDVPAGCAAALKCTPIEFCTAEGVMSNTTVILTRDQEAYRVPLTDCKDVESGRIGKCCRDPYYTDPWPSTQLGKWVPGVFGGNDGQYVPDSRGSPSTNVRPQVVTSRPDVGSVYLNNFRTEKPIGSTFGPNQITPGFPATTVSPGSYVQKGQFGQGQVGSFGQGQIGTAGQGQVGVIGIGQGNRGSQGQFGQGTQLSTSTSTFGQAGSRGQGQVVTQGQGQFVTQGQGIGVNRGQGFGVTQGQGVGVTQGAGFGVSQGGGFGVSQGGGFGVSQGQGQAVSQGSGQSVSQGFGQSVSQGFGQSVSQGVGQVVTQGQGTYSQGGRGQFGVGQVGISQQGQAVSQGQGVSVSRGQGQGFGQGQGVGVLTGQGTGVSRGQGQVVTQGQGFGVSRGQGQSVSQGQGQVTNQGQGFGVSQGAGFGVSRGQGQTVNQGFGASQTGGFGVTSSRGQGQTVSQGQGFGVTQGQGFGVSRGQGQSVSQGVGQSVSQGAGQSVSQGQRFGVSQSGGQSVSQGQGFGVSQGGGLGVSRGQGQSVSQGSGQSVSAGQGFGISSGQGQAVTGGQGQFNSGGFGVRGQGQAVSQGGGQSVSQGAGFGVSQGGGQSVSQGAGFGVSQGAGFGVSQGAGFGVSQGGGQSVSQGAGFGVSQGQGQFGVRGQGQSATGGQGNFGFGQGFGQSQGQGVIRGGGGGTLSFGLGQAITQGQGEALTQGQGQAVIQGGGQSVSQGVVTGVRRGQGFAVSQGAGYGVENEYSESVQRVFLKQYSGTGQCGVLNSQKPYGNRNDLEVDFAEIPWQAMVLLQTNKSLLCGGVITRPDVVITSAACVDGLEAKNVLIKGGEWKLGIDDEPLPFQIVQVKTILRHPFYVRGSLKYDAAILVLTENLRFAKNIYPICLPSSTDTLDAYYNGAGECLVTGWGKQVLQAHLQGSIMHSINVSLVNPGECQTKLSQDYPHLLEQYDQDSCVCGQPTNPANNICKVDIGSALACTTGDGYFTLRGVYSWDSGCQIGNQIAAFYRFDLEWYEWAIGLIESVRFAQYTKGTKITKNQYSGEIKSSYTSGVKGSSGGKASAAKGQAISQFGAGQFGAGQFSQFGSSSKYSNEGSGSLLLGTDINGPISNTYSATYSEIKGFQTEPKIITYTTKPEIVTFTTKPEYFTYTTKPKLVTYTTKPQIITYTTKPEIISYTTKPEIITYTTKPKIVTYTTKPQIITYETSGSGTNPQYVAPGVTFNPSFSELTGTDHKHNGQCKCLEGK